MERNEILAHIWEAGDSGAIIHACAWCGRLQIEGKWIEPPVGALSTIDERMTLSHSICPECSAGQQP